MKIYRRIPENDLEFWRNLLNVIFGDKIQIFFFHTWNYCFRKTTVRIVWILFDTVTAANEDSVWFSGKFTIKSLTPTLKNSYKKIKLSIELSDTSDQPEQTVVDWLGCQMLQIKLGFIFVTLLKILPVRANISGSSDFRGLFSWKCW